MPRKSIVSAEEPPENEQGRPMVVKLMIKKGGNGKKQKVSAMGAKSNLHEFYNKHYHERQHANLIADDKYFWARAEASADLYFSEKEKSLRVFEFGCGIGQGIAALPHSSGWDISSEARAIARKKGVNVYEELTDIPLAQWDIVFCRHVLEHVENPLSTLRFLRSLVAPGGSLLLVLPKERQYECPLTPDLNMHLFAWNFRSINNLLAVAGFVPVKNSEKYILGYRVLLPVRRVLGKFAYSQLVRMVGWLYRNGELIIWADVSVE